MKIVAPSYKILTQIDGKEILKRIEAAGRTCYKSEDKITDESAEKFVSMVIKRGHHSVIEHESLSVRFVCDRGVTHEMVRHRLCSVSQESTRYVNYQSDDIQFIKPMWYDDSSEHQQKIWELSCRASEAAYKDLITSGWRPEQARSVLPNSLKTEIVITANMREWRHILNLRCSKAAHPQMREIMVPLLFELSYKLPCLFQDIVVSLGMSNK